MLIKALWIVGGTAWLVAASYLAVDYYHTQKQESLERAWDLMRD